MYVKIIRINKNVINKDLVYEYPEIKIYTDQSVLKKLFIITDNALRSMTITK